MPWLRKGAFDCDKCPDDYGLRKVQRCGRHPEDRRLKGPDPDAPSFGGKKWAHDVCPGWAARLPIVQEAWRAMAAGKAGYPVTDRNVLLLEAVLVAQNADGEHWEATHPTPEPKAG